MFRDGCSLNSFYPHRVHVNLGNALLEPTFWNSLWIFARWSWGFSPITFMVDVPLAQKCVSQFLSRMSCCDQYSSSTLVMEINYKHDLLEELWHFEFNLKWIACCTSTQTNRVDWSNQEIRLFIYLSLKILKPITLPHDCEKESPTVLWSAVACHTDLTKFYYLSCNFPLFLLFQLFLVRMIYLIWTFTELLLVSCISLQISNFHSF